MNEREVVQGQHGAWGLLKKLGEGDAGEIYLVESLAGAQVGILKRPRKSVFPGDVARQASQIRSEGKILKLLGAELNGKTDGLVSVPTLLDLPRPKVDYDTSTFIIIEKARGFDLAFLSRVCQIGISDEHLRALILTAGETAFLDTLAETRRMPERMLISILHAILETFETIHALHAQVDDLETWGVIWNDVKPDHLFWDPQRSSLTLIDWGNARFLEADRTTRDRQASWADDYRQLFEAMFRYLELSAPDLLRRLKWPAQATPETATHDALADLMVRLETAFQESATSAEEIRQVEASLLERGPAAAEDPLAALEAVQQRLVEQGEAPDAEGALRFAAGFAARLVMEDRLDELQSVCAWVEARPNAGPGWPLIRRLAYIPGGCQGDQRQCFLDALQAAICGGWDGALWNLLSAIRDDPEPEWWQEITHAIRQQALQVEGDALRPLVTVSRLALSLQSLGRSMLDRPAADDPEIRDLVISAARELREGVITRWRQIDPEPPYSTLEYSDLDEILAGTRTLMLPEQSAISRLVSAPKAQVELVLEAWDRRDFLAANRGLRRLLLFDPDRRRVLRAEQALRSAPGWLTKAHLGPQAEENFPEWVTSLEFEGREMRNAVGPAAWLDVLLESLRRLRRGAWPADLLVGHPDLIRELPWLGRFERAERVPAAPEEADAPAALPLEAPFPAHSGVTSGQLGPVGDVALFDALDAWMPEARGSSARVLLGQIQTPQGPVDAAIKLMRMDKVAYSLPLFREEVQILSIMKDVPGVMRMYESGFLKVDGEEGLPLGDPNPARAPVTGRVMRIGVDSGEDFLGRIDQRIEDGWVPYLALELFPKEESLLLQCDAGMVHGEFLPVITLLQMAIQICDILQVAHSRGIVYRDHKILHYYWKATQNGVYLIDWNVARIVPGGVTQADVQMDLVQFAARGLHHVLTGRSAPGALPLGPTRPEDIEQSARSYQTQWTYDDQRLPESLREVIERALSGEYARVEDLRDDLKATYIQVPYVRL
ncbi:MAG TPA: serine/threonine-protein kinase [Anaerolineaceae bacterium]